MTKSRHFANRTVRTAILAAALLFPSEAGSVPAKPGLLRFDNCRQTIEVAIHGDENNHYYTSADGYLLLRGADGVFHYAVPSASGDSSVPSRSAASDPSARTAAEVAELASFDKREPFAIMERVARKKKPRRTVQARTAEESLLNTFPTKGSPRCLAILVQYQDVRFSLPEPRQLFDDMLNQEGFSRYGATGSVKDYFEASSGGQFTPEFDVYGPVTLPYNMSYYGGNGSDGNDARPYEMVPHALDMLKDEIDFSTYDTDNDGVVDNIYIFYAGYGEADGGPANSVWPHSWNIHDDLGYEIRFNGKLINHYATSNELSNGSGQQLAGIGVFCHEFSHVMGLPDLYSTTYTGTFTPDAWSLMDHGSYNNNGHTPPYHTGYERYCLGWVEPKLLADPANITMYPVSQTGAYDDVYIIPTENRTEYYIFENRQQRGWDQYIPGHGLLAWHIDFVPDIWNLNIVNVEKQHIDIVEADNIRTEDTRQGDTFPGTAGVTEFTDDTTPSMKSWNGNALRSPLTDIREINGVIYFVFKGGRDIFDKVMATDPTEIKPSWFTASWEPVANASGYILSVYRKETDGDRTEKVFVEGLRKREVGNVTSFRVEGLDPETTYHYVVAATDGRFDSADSNEVEVTTTAPTLDYRTVTALSASEVSGTSFRANWQPLDEAEGYEVSLYRLELGEAFEARADFTGREIPEGWSSDASYDGRSSYAVEAPSLRMTADGSQLTSAALAGIRSLRFWYRAGSVGEDAALAVSLFSNDGWKELKTVAPLVTAPGGAYVGIDDIPSQASKIRISFRRGAAGSVSIDDVVVGYGGNLAFTPVSGRQNMDAGSELSMTVSGLDTDTDYGYSITARNSEFRSHPSEIIGVRTGTSGVASLVGGVSVRIEGRTVSVVSQTAEPVSVTDLSGTVLATGGSGAFSFTAASPGVVLLRIGDRVAKCMLR